LISEFCRESAQPRSCREQLSAADFKFEIFRPWPAQEQREHGAYFARRATRDIDKLQKFGGRAAFETLGDVIRDGQHGAFELIAERSPHARRRVFQKIVGQFIEPRRLAPDRQIFESLVGHARQSKISNLKFEIKNASVDGHGNRSG